MIRKFENKTNSNLYVESSKLLSVIIGNYDNSQEIYDNSSTSTNYRITTYNGTTFYITSNYGNVEMGHILGGVFINKETHEKSFTKDVSNCRILRFSKNLNGIKPGAKISERLILNYYHQTYNPKFILTVANSKSKKSQKYLEGYVLQDNEILLEEEFRYDIKKFDKFIYNNPISMPNWIYENAILTFTKTIDPYSFDIENRGKIIKHIATVKYIDINSVKPYFVVDKNTEISLNDMYFKISNNNNQNNKNYIVQNTKGDKINLNIKEFDNGEFIKCTKFKCNKGGLLLYDQLCDKKKGTVNGNNNDNKIFGTRTEFMKDFKLNDYIFFDNDYNKLYRIKNIISNTEIQLYQNLQDDINESNIFLTDNISDRTESIIYDTYNENNNNNIKNIMPIRGNRRINYRFGVEEKTIRNISGNSFKIDIDKNLYKIYKLWINGMLLDEDKYVMKNNNILEILDDNNLKKYNNYCHIIYYPQTDSTTENNYAFLDYYGYDIVYNCKQDYMNNLYSLLFYNNFSESPNYSYHEFKDELLGVNKRIKLDKNNSLTFSSYITNDINTSNNKVITTNLENIINNYFRLIKHNTETNTFTIYDKCEIVNPSSETINDDLSLITYNINYKDKIILNDNLKNKNNNKFNIFELNKIAIY